MARGDASDNHASGGHGLARPTEGSTWVLDLDGVVWLAGEPIAGGGHAVDRLHEAGARVLFASDNDRAPTIAELIKRFERAGIHAEPEDIVTSAQAAVELVPAGSKVLVVGGGGLREALEHASLETVEDPKAADAVIVGWTREFTFDRLTVAARAVWHGARLIGTDDDPSHPTPDGLLPGTGAIVAAVATASGAKPEIAGKPFRPLADLVSRLAPEVSVVVGDRPSTDGALAHQIKAPFALVLSGVTPEGGDYGDPPPDVVAADLAAVVDLAFS